VPPTLDWDLWLGPAPNGRITRPTCPAVARLVELRERDARDFFCTTATCVLALDLRHPTTVEAEGPCIRKAPPAGRSLAPIPGPRRAAAGRAVLYNGGGYPALVKERQVPQWSNAVLFIGRKGC